jgi:hypothetical protein
MSARRRLAAALARAGDANRSVEKRIPDEIGPSL